MAENFYTNLIKNENSEFDLEIQRKIKKTVENLISNNTNIDRPGILLGKIQSGKTKTFIRIIALCFDSGYDISIILTKGTNPLALQTYRRLKSDFHDFDDDIFVYDIMHMPEKLTKYERKKKLIFVVKKETNNLNRINKLLELTYPDLKEKRILIIDDEADYASIGYHKSEDGIELNKINRQINDLRTKVKSYDYLQVTATPYSIYLQPNADVSVSMEFKPVRPAFTTVLPSYPGYVGGEFFFRDFNEIDIISDKDFELARNAFREVPADELEILKKQDKRSFKLKDALSSARIHSLRESIINFIVGGCIRNIQLEKLDKRSNKYSFLIHTEIAKSSHEWQSDIVEEIKTQLEEEANNSSALYRNLVQESYNSIYKSVSVLDNDVPSFDEAFHKTTEAILDEQVVVIKINSDSDIKDNLNEDGQLMLRNPFNIFIGGSILDRGITIENLIGFYYGRRPKKTQQDTALQHARIYGNRPKGDLAVTRFYTSRAIFEILERIYEFDKNLREHIESKNLDDNIIFIQKDENNKVIPCSPNKIMLSSVHTLRPWKRILPIGFQTDYKSYLCKKTEKIDEILREYASGDKAEPFLIRIDDFFSIMNLIKGSYKKFEEGYEWDFEIFNSIIEYLAINQSADKQHILVLVRKNRNLKRVKLDGGYADAPDTPKTEGAIAKEVAINRPIVMLFRQNGKEDDGWRGGPFWWPVLVPGKNTKTAIFASDVANETEKE